MLTVTLSIAGLLILTLLIIVAAKNKDKSKFKRYEAFAHKNGFEYHLNNEPGRNTPQIIGEKEGVLFEIIEIVIGTSTESVIYTVIRIYNTPFGFDFRISKANFFNKIGNKVGLNDVQINHEELDDKLVFKTSSDTQLRKFMNDDRIHKFTNIVDQLEGAFKNENDQFEYTHRGELISPKQWEHFETMLAFTTQLIRNENSQLDS